MKSFGSILILCGVISVAIGCNSDEPESEATSGGESAFETAEKNVNQAQKDLQAELKQERQFVDEKAKQAVGEGRKAASKVGDALSGGNRDDAAAGKS